MVVLAQVDAHGIIVRLVERAISRFAIIYDDGRLYAINHQTTDRAQATIWFDRAVEIAEASFTHPAWRQRA